MSKLSTSTLRKPPSWRGWSAQHVLSFRLRAFFIAAIISLAALALITPLLPMIVIIATLTGCFVASTWWRVRYCVAGYNWNGASALPIPVELLPRYTILTAVYKEANIACQLLSNLHAIDYPKELLQTLILCEEDDVETQRAMKAHLYPGQEVIVVPNGVPRTKPRALNAALPMITGEIFTIYDAEDRPDPQQLRLAVSVFRSLPERIATLQARLVYENSRQNLLTRWFAGEYTTHFSLYLQGMTILNHAVPLGGTSTHFRTHAVRQVGGWDQYNVTEDCELGMRLFAAGYRTQTLDSDTFEEACSESRKWVKQRSRWIKGFTQTGLAMLRTPLRTRKEMGTVPYFAALTSTLGIPIALCFQLVSWLMMIAYIILRTQGISVDIIEQLYPVPVLLVGMILLTVGNAAVFATYLLGLYKSERWHLLRACIGLPLYWVLTSLGAWKGVLQLLWKPHYWEKTEHHGIKHVTIAKRVPVREKVMVEQHQLVAVKNKR